MHYLKGPQFNFFEIKNHPIHVYYENIFTFDFQLSNLSLMICQFVQKKISNKCTQQPWNLDIYSFDNLIYKSNNGGVYLCGQCLEDSSSHYLFPINNSFEHTEYGVLNCQSFWPPGVCLH